MLTQAFLKAIFEYDPSTGDLHWRARGDLPARWNSRYAGTVAGFDNGDGAIRVSINNKKFLAHRVIWRWMTGEMPVYLDHRDLDRKNNRWENLRLSTKSQNSANTPRRSTNTSGFKGVCWSTKEKKWQVNITVNYKQRRLGVFDCPAAGHFAYIVAAHEEFGEFARAA